MLRLNDDGVAEFEAERLSGRLRVGVPTDFSNAPMQRAIAEFAAQHSRIKIEVTTRLSRDLPQALAADQLDLTIAIAPEDGMPWLVQSFQAQFAGNVSTIQSHLHSRWHCED